MKIAYLRIAPNANRSAALRYSSLDVLRFGSSDCIKLNASFMAEIETDEQAVSILRSVAALGTTLKMPVLAEGVEQPAELSIVAREECSAIQDT